MISFTDGVEFHGVLLILVGRSCVGCEMLWFA